MNFITFFNEILTDWPIGTIAGILFFACILTLIILVARLLFAALDSWFLLRKNGIGRIVAKTFTPAHTEIILIYNSATQTNMPHLIPHSDDWSVRVEVDDKQDSISISKIFFDSLSEDDQVTVEYVRGRLSGNIYIKELSLHI